MNKSIKRAFSMLMAAMLMLSLCACGSSAPADAAGPYDFGDYELIYKGACVMSDSNGEDALVMTFDFTNNSKENASYGWTVFEKVVQDGEDLESTYVIADMENLTGVTDAYFTDVEPGNTLEVSTAFKLNSMSKVEMTISDLLDDNVYTITVDPSAIERVEGDYIGVEGGAEASYLDWWNGDWYGWWVIKYGSGEYDEYDGYWWDVCARIEAIDDTVGFFEVWDVDGSPDDLCGAVEVSFSESGIGEHGTMFSEDGAFMDDVLEHADWIVDPGLMKVDDLLCIDGTYDGEEGSYSYEIYLRPWGTLWDDITGDVLPYDNSLPYTYDWYLSFVNAGAAMPDSFSATVPDGSSVSEQQPEAAPAAEEASTAPAAASTGKMKEYNVDITPFYDKNETTMKVSLPEGEWCVEDVFSENVKIHNSATVEESGFWTSYIWIKTFDDDEVYDRHSSKYTNVKDTDGYTIGGIEMKGRTVDYVGYENMQEYYGQLPNGVWISINFVKPSEEILPVCYAILDTISFS